MKRWFLVLTILALVLPAAALAQSGQARLRLVQVAPNAPPLDLVINGNTVFGSLEFKADTPYVLVPPGSTNLRVAPTGASEAPLINVEANLSACTDYTLLPVGGSGQVEPLLLLDDNSPPSPGQARVRFVNASPDAPAVDVSLQGGPVLFSNVPFKGTVGYASLNSGSLTFEVRQAATENLLLSVPGVVLESCSVYTIYLAGFVSGEPPLQAFTTADAVTACAVPVPTAVKPLAVTPTSTSTPVPIIVPRPVASLTPSATATAVPPTPLPTLSPVPATPSPTSTATTTPSATPVVTAVAAATATPKLTATATGTLAPTVSATPTTATPTATGTMTATVGITATATATATPTATGTMTATVGITPTATATATPTATGTMTPTLTATPVTPTPAATATSTRAATATSMPAATATSMPTATATSMPAATATRMPTAKSAHTPQPTPPAPAGITAVPPQNQGMDSSQQGIILPTPWWMWGPRLPW